MCSAEAREPYGREVQPLQSPGTASAEPGLCPALWATQGPLRTHRTTVCSVQPHSKGLEGTSEGAGSEAKPWPSCLLLSCHLGGETPRSRLREPATGHVYLLPIGQLSTAGTEATFSPLWHKYSQTRASENGKYSFCQRSQWVKTPGAAQQGCL